MPWFQLKTGADPTLSPSYDPKTTPTCSGSGKICAVNADDNGSGQPDLTESLKDQMILALQTGTPSTNVKLRSTP